MDRVESAKDRTQEVNVRVAVRVRPLLPKEKCAGDETCVRLIPSNKQLIIGKDRAFTYDYVLSTKSTQDEAYSTCVDSLVRSIFEGYNATVFAYGQTGSGKTYTIGGGNISSLTEEEYGIIPRALKQMFDMMQSEQNVVYSVKVSYIEIYKEELQDLLDLETSSKDLHVREDDKGNTVIIGVREVECETLDDVMSLLVSGSAVRHTGSTQMNEHSSRSHSIFTVVIAQNWTEGDVMASKRKQTESLEMVDDEIHHNMTGKFHFVDLAGSERAHKTGNVGDRFKESVHINSGLLALGNVISALGDPKKKSSHIPYRESKITRLLKDSLGGNAKTLMICCISPSTTNFDESLNALKYANRARNIKNKPIVNRDIQSIRFEEMQTEIKLLREELARQRTSVLSNGGLIDVDPEKAMKDASHIKTLEDQVVRLQTECGHYKVIAEEAYKQLTQLQGKDFLSKSQDIRLKDWLDLMEEIKNKVPTTLSMQDMESQTIKDLQSELKKAREDLKSDEEIFAEKIKEVNLLRERVEELESLLEQREQGLIDAEDKYHKQEQQLIEQQMKLEELQKALKGTQPSESFTNVTLDTEGLIQDHPAIKATLVGNSTSLDESAVTCSAPPTTRQRPKSVPVHLHKRQEGQYSQLRPPSRNIKTSPALFTLERVMKSFRARSQLLVSRLEDSDEVLHLEFCEETSEKGGDSGSGESEEEQRFKRFTYVCEDGKFVRKGTFRVKKGKDENKENSLPEITISSDVAGEAMKSKGGNQEEAPVITSSTDVQKKIKQAQLKMLESNMKIRDLAINIKMKEQLIRELVKTGKDAESMNRQYADKVSALEREREHVKQELAETQRALTDLEAKEQQESEEKKKLQQEYRKKVEQAKARMSALQKKQKETEKVAGLATQNEKKIQDLELAVDRMKQQQEHLHKRLRDESERKVKLERERTREQQRVKELEIKNEQQQKILRRKNEEIASAKRRLRSGTTLPPIHVEDHDKLEEQKRWLDVEVEKIVSTRRQMEELQEALKKREEIVAKKEAMLAEKSELEIKKLRSSQVLNKSIVTLSAKLETVERKLEEKSRELAHTPEERMHVVKEEIHKLKGSRDRLQKQRAALDDKLHEGSLLSEQEERRLIELDEAIDALDAAIEYKSDVIHSRQLEVRHSHAFAQSEDHLMNKLNALSTLETKSLLTKYFEKVIDLREKERKASLQYSEMQVKTEEQERLIREMEGALQRSAVDVDRRLMVQQQKYEQKIQLLMHQLAEGSGAAAAAGAGGGDSQIEIRLQQVEKDLYYYKKTSRELKKKLKELIASGTISAQEVDLRASVQSSFGDQDHGLLGNAHHSRETNSARVRDSRTMNDRHAESRSSADRSRTNSGKPSVSSNVTPVKISRRDLRLMTDAEVSMRRSNLKESVGSPPAPKDSLDPGGNNPWG